MQAGSDYITATDIKNWVYCPMIVYFRKVLRLKPKLFSQQKNGQEMHREMLRKIASRVGIALRDKRIKIRRKISEKEIILENEKLYGIIDLIVETEQNEIIPVEIKLMKSNNGKPWRDHIYQLTFYAILIERKMRKLIKRGFIYYVNEEKLIEVPITNHERKLVWNIIRNIRLVMQTEKPPKVRIHPKYCTGGCGYKWVCRKIKA